ncbi:hypothetical protein MesoLjLb_32020 [Mesorhizobium sp. L-8-3]|nr:hypothetical protein MesoLjLb_32020 [Mesorhizobium sp. L-8-3]
MIAGATTGTAEPDNCVASGTSFSCSGNQSEGFTLADDAQNSGLNTGATGITVQNLSGPSSFDTKFNWTTAADKAGDRVLRFDSGETTVSYSDTGSPAASILFGSAATNDSEGARNLEFFVTGTLANSTEQSEFGNAVISVLAPGAGGQSHSGTDCCGNGSSGGGGGGVNVQFNEVSPSVTEITGAQQGLYLLSQGASGGNAENSDFDDGGNGGDGGGASALVIGNIGTVTIRWMRTSQMRSPSSPSGRMRGAPDDERRRDCRVPPRRYIEDGLHGGGKRRALQPVELA